MSNATLSEEELHGLMPKFWVYVAQGGLLSVVNVLIFAAIVRFDMLRKKKEYIVVAALAFTDAANGIACLSAGLVRNLWILSGSANILVSRWGCVWLPWNICWLFWEHSYGVMLSLVSVDRLIAVSIPLKYFTFGKGYALTLVGGVHAALFINIGISLYFSYPYQHPERPRICYSDWMYDTAYYTYVQNLTLVWSIASLVIYAFVLIIFSQKKKVAPAQGQSSQAKNAHKAQRRLTITLGLSSLFTFVFHIFPLIIKFVLVSGNQSTSFSSMIIPYIYIIQNINPLLNFFLYTKRHKDIKLAVKCLFTCHDLTPLMLGTNVTDVKSGHHTGKHEITK